jgi:tetratricopeptide (TPR) repeat protein
LSGRRPSINPDNDLEFTDESLGTFELNTDNGMGLNKGTLHNYVKEDGLLFRDYSAALDNYNAEIATAVNSMVENTVSRSRSIEGGFPLCVANPSSIAHIVTSFYILKSERLRPLTQAISQPLFQTNGDPCVLTQQERIAIACLNSIQTRISNFILNAGILFPAIGWGFNVPDTIDMVSGYLAKKFEYEMTEKKMFDIYLKSMDDVDKAFSKGPANEAGVSFDISTTSDLREKFKLAIKLSVQSMFFNISRQSFVSPNRNPYEEQVYDNRGTTLLNFLRTGEVLLGGRTVSIEGYNAASSLAGFTDGEYQRPAVAPTVAALQQAGGFDAGAERTWTQQYGYYYMPINLLSGLSLIFYDYAVKPQDRLPNFKFFAEKRIANADDTLLTAINPENISAFSERFSGYPLTVRGVTYYSDDEVLKAIKEFERQFESYDRILNILKTPLFEGGDGSYNFLSYKGGAQTYTILGNTPQENQFQGFQLGNLEFNSPTFTDNSENDGRDFFNPLYGMYVPIFKRLPVEEQDYWIKQALMYNYADSTLLAYVPLGDEMGTPQQRANPETQRAFAFYERKRILEIAKPEGSDYTFLALYKRSYNTFVNRNPYAPVGERSREGRRKIQQWVAKERTEALTRNTSTNDDLSGVIKTYGSRERNNFDMINYPQPGQWGIRRGKLVLDSDYLRRGGGPAPYNAQGYQLVSLEDDIVSYWRSLIAGPTSSRNNDLIKIAINHLYFVLSYQTQLRIADINPDDPSSSVNLLKRHLGLS